MAAVVVVQVLVQSHRLYVLDSVGRLWLCIEAADGTFGDWTQVTVPEV